MGSSSSKSCTRKHYKDYNKIIKVKHIGKNRSNKDYNKIIKGKDIDKDKKETLNHFEKENPLQTNKDYNEIIEGKDIEVNRSNKDYKDYYEIGEEIGRGGFGTIYKGREKNKDELRAIKVIDLNRIRENPMYQIDENQNIEEKLKSYINRFIEEFEIMKKCCYNNNNSVKCYEYFKNDNNFVIIMELYDKNLSKLLLEKKKEYNRYFNSEEILEIMEQLNNTFKIMIENKIIHRDLKLENILDKKRKWTKYNKINRLWL